MTRIEDRFVYMIDAFLQELYLDGCRNDSVADSRESMRFNITPSTGQFLDILVSDLQPARILEIGTSNGYSTIWLARAAERCDASLESIDIDRSKTDSAAENLRQVGLDKRVKLHNGDAGNFLIDTAADTFDFVFLDSFRQRYLDWAADLVRVTRFGIVVVDNATSHPEEMADFSKFIRDQEDLAACVLPIGKGQMVITRAK